MGGLGVIGAADLPPDMALELGTAYVMDVTSPGGNNATMRTAERLAHASDRAGSERGDHVPAQPARPAGTMASEAYRFTCPSGQTHEIVVPYLDLAKLAVKKSFARSMACNLVDDMQVVMQACMADFGRSDCGEGLERVAEDPLG